MKLLLEKAKEHFDSQDETYLQHMHSALKISYTLQTIALKCAVHSAFPFLYTTALSEKIDYLQKMTNRTDK